MEISYGQGPCDKYYVPPNESGKCPEDHRFIDEMTGCIPEGLTQPPILQIVKRISLYQREHTTDL